MRTTFFFENINILLGPMKEVFKDSILIVNGRIEAFGEAAKKEAIRKNIDNSLAGNKLIAPLLVDIHSTLKDPLVGNDDNLDNIKYRAKKSGYGGIALLPNSDSWRDRPERIPFQKNNDSDINFFFWGSFSLEDKGVNLSPHKELLESGAIGLSSKIFFDSSIIYKGLKLDDMKSLPILFSLTNNKKSNKGIVKKDLRSLQSGFYVIEDDNELSNIRNILEIKNLFPDKNIILKNISNSNSLEEIKNAKVPISTTISWWSLIADTNNLKVDDIGWKADPPLGSAENREILIQGLENNLIQAIAVNSYPLNDENTLKPINERAQGISSYELVLPLLWEEFVNKRNWSIAKLWGYLSFQPSSLLGINQEKLCVGSNRWLLFDPESKWQNNQINLGYDYPSNFPKKNELIKGQVTSCGLDC